MEREQIHASCVDIAGRGVLLRGPSGAGKSDLALRLVDGGAFLVADDRVDLERAGESVVARPPAPLAGLIEVRGVGILPCPRTRPETPVVMICDLVDAGAVERLPPLESESILGVTVRRLALHAFDASTPAKIRLALDAPPRDMLNPS